MQKIVELTKQTFSKEFLKVSPKIHELSGVLLFIFKTGGLVQSSVISTIFPNFANDMEKLVRIGLIEVKGDTITFTEGFEEKLLSKDLREIDSSYINKILSEVYFMEILRNFGSEEFINSLSTALSAIILSSTPNQPALLSKALRTSDKLLTEFKLTPDSILSNSRSILENYLKPLELVDSVGNFGITLSEKSKQLIETNRELWGIYNKGKEQPKLPEKVQ